jgi:hypothetical protein
MRNAGSSGYLFFAGGIATACICVVAGAAAGTGTPMIDASDGGPYVVTNPATCPSSQYLSTADGSTMVTGATPSTWGGPAPYDAGQATFNGDIFQMLGISNPDAGVFTYNGIPAPYTDATGCKAFDSQGHPNAHNCLCDNCFTMLQQCDALVGCRAILKCAEDSGCTTANSCYLATNAPCQTVINNYGTGSVSTGLESDLGTCGVNAKCPAQ